MPRYRLKEEQLRESYNRDYDGPRESLGIKGQEVVIMQESENSDLVAVKNIPMTEAARRSGAPYYKTTYYTLKSNIEEIPESKLKVSIDISDKFDVIPTYEDGWIKGFERGLEEAYMIAGSHGVASDIREEVGELLNNVKNNKDQITEFNRNTQLSWSFQKEGNDNY